MSVIEILIAFSIFVVLQSLMINGVHDCFKGKKIIDEATSNVYYQGQIFYTIAPKFFEKYKHKNWSKPLWSCVKCMASVYGGLSYWPLVIWLFEFDWFEILIYVFDVFILVYLNNYFYLKN